MPHPPEYARATIELLVPHARRDSILGDLLEEYHEAQVPQHGVRAADRWFVRQALGFLWSASARPGVAIAAILTIRMLIDVGAPSPDLVVRARLTTFAAFGLFVAFGFRLGRSTGRANSAAPMAIAATFLGTIYAYAMVFVCMAAAATIVHPSTAAWAGLREGLDVPAHVIAIVGVVLATAGATAGRLFSGSSGSRASIGT